MTPPLGLQHALSALIGDAQLVPCPLPGTALSLWLLDADNMDRAFSQEETRRILHEPPYWSFCWASGLALARYLAAHPEWVAGKRVLDFGAGSGVAGIAAVKAGALEVVACDLDPLALAACRANAELNQVALSYSADFFCRSRPLQPDSGGRRALRPRQLAVAGSVPDPRPRSAGGGFAGTGFPASGLPAAGDPRGLDPARSG